jgi:hypothetical protein
LPWPEPGDFDPLKLDRETLEPQDETRDCDEEIQRISDATMMLDDENHCHPLPRYTSHDEDTFIIKDSFGRQVQSSGESAPERPQPCSFDQQKM